jgi:putative ABC transport system ATP-binding protein
MAVMPDREATAPGLPGAPTGGPADPVLRADRLYRFYRAGDEETLALQGVSFQVERGESVAVVGPSGSGKSTLMACLAGLDEPDGGSVVIAGHRLSHRPERARARLRAGHIGVLTQHTNLIPHLDIRANIVLAQAAGPRNRHRPDPGNLLRDAGLSARGKAMPRQLSGGELARAGLAVALANSPSVILADEPTGELDGDTERQVLDLLKARATAGAALVLVTHSPALTRHADRVLELHDGRLAA